MRDCLLWNASNSCFVINEQNVVLEVLDFNSQLFFGLCPNLGNTVAESLDNVFSSEKETLLRGIDRAMARRRNSCFEYISTASGADVPVGVFAEYSDGLLCLRLVNLEASELDDSSEKFDSARQVDQLLKDRQKFDMAMRVGSIMMWEFDVASQLFYSEFEPLNGFNKSKPITIEDYFAAIHPSYHELARENIRQMLSGEDFTYSFDISFRFDSEREWEHSTITGSPLEFDDQGNVTKYVGFRKMNTELYHQRSFYEQILNDLPLSILIKDVENDYRYLFCNKESKSLFGMVEGGTVADILDDESVIRICRTDLEVFQTGQQYNGLEEIVLNDGRRYNTIVQKSIIEDYGRRLLLSVRWDQSVHIELKRQANLLNISLEVMSAYTWLYEPHLGRITFGEEFNRLGRKIEEVNSLETYIARVHPDDRAYFLLSLDRVVQGKDSKWSCQFRFDCSGHEDYIWEESKGVMETITVNEKPYTYLLGMTVCIQEHRRVEQTLRQNEADLNKLILQNELILNNINSGLAYITTDYVVQWENISICSTSISFEAYKQGEICYKSTHGRTSPCDQCVLQRAIASREVERITFRLQNDRMVEVFATPVFGNNGEVEGVVIRMDDITKREQMFSELRLAKLQAEQSDKLKSAFLANMSHEIRTPLNAIVGFSELLLDANNEDKEEYINIIKSNNDLLLGLINDILDLSKIESGTIELKYENFDFSAHFQQLFMSMQQRITNPQLELNISNPVSYCQVYLDKVRITQIVTNYVTNAIKYTPKGRIEMGYELSDEGIRIYVKDTGIGISDANKNKVFHRFAKLDEFAQGTGLGLSICKATAEIMGGAVGFETQENVGSHFWAFLPCTPILERITINSETTTITTPIKRSNKRKVVLVAEDIPNNYLLISKMLHKKFDLLHAIDGKDAIEIVKKRDIDLVFMDMKMPKVDGMSATRTIRSFNKEIPIVALTAHAFEVDRAAAIAAGCSDYLIKPIDQGRLMSVLRKYDLLK